MTFYQRRLPHWHPEGTPLFVTWRLAGSLPPHRFFAAGEVTCGRAFAAMDRLLDQARWGPRHLNRPDIAALVVATLRFGETPLGHYTLHAFAVMPNHVHVLLTPLVPLPKLLRSLKAASARRANQILGTTGQAFWQEEAYDHFVRDDRQFARIRAYIECNPVRAGLAAAPEEYPWSSATASHGLAADRGSAPP